MDLKSTVYWYASNLKSNSTIIGSNGILNLTKEPYRSIIVLVATSLG